MAVYFKKNRTYYKKWYILKTKTLISITIVFKNLHSFSFIIVISFFSNLHVKNYNK